MSPLRLGVALVFAGLLAVVIVREIATGGDFSGVIAISPVGTLAVAYILGEQFLKVFYGRKGDDAS